MRVCAGGQPGSASGVDRAGDESAASAQRGRGGEVCAWRVRGGPGGSRPDENVKVEM